MKTEFTLETLLLGLLLMAFTQTVSAQNFIESPQTQPFTGTIYSSMAFADVDGDNDQDVLITGLDSSNNRISILYTNDGSGIFTEVLGTPFDGVEEGSIAFADVDDDGDEDVLITGRTNSGSIATLYTNDGSGNFTEVMGTPFDGVRQSSIAFADVDGDKDLDVLITGENNSFAQIAKLYTNDGSGNYTEVLGTPFEGVDESAITFADVDGDSDPDLLLTGFNFISGVIARLYTNDGTGNFSEIMNTPFYGVGASSVAFADVDNDNDQDVLISGATNTDRITTLYTNDGIGNFTEVTGTPFIGVAFSSVAFADVDSDNDEDLLIIGQTMFDHFSVLYSNDGTGNFSEVPNTPFDDINNGAIAFADVDGDNDQDVLITGQNDTFVNHISTLYLNETLLSSADFNADITLSIYPNPVRDVLNIQTNYPIETIEIFNMNGKLIKFEKRPSTRLYLESLDSGTYLLRIQIDTGFETKKIVKL